MSCLSTWHLLMLTFSRALASTMRCGAFKLTRSDLQELVRSISGNREGSGQSQEQLLRTLEHRLGLRGPGGGHQGPSHHRGSTSGRSRSSNLSNLERVGSAGSEQRLYRGTRSDGEPAPSPTHSPIFCLYLQQRTSICSRQECSKRLRQQSAGGGHASNASEAQTFYKPRLEMTAYFA